MNTVHIGYAKLLVACLAQHEVGVTDLYSSDTLSTIGNAANDARISIQMWDSLMMQADAHIPDQDMALTMAAFIKPIDTGAIGFLTMACRTLKESAEALSQFYPLLNDVYTLHVEMAGDRLTSTLLPTSDYRSPYLEKLTLGTMCWHNRWLVARREDLCFDARFPFARPPAPLHAQFARTFGGDVIFGAETAALIRPPGAENLPVSRGDLAVQQTLRTELLTALSSRSDESDSVVLSVEAFIRDRVEQPEILIKDAAIFLGMSVRTLQTRLESQGWTFSSLLDRVRYAQAVAHLANPKLSLIEVGYLVGFSSQSSFTRAFMRWTSMAPGEYRRKKSAA